MYKNEVDKSYIHNMLLSYNLLLNKTSVLGIKSCG